MLQRLKINWQWNREVSPFVCYVIWMLLFWRSKWNLSYFLNSKIFIILLMSYSCKIIEIVFHACKAGLLLFSLTLDLLSHARSRSLTPVQRKSIYLTRKKSSKPHPKKFMFQQKNSHFRRSNDLSDPFLGAHNLSSENMVDNPLCDDNWKKRVEEWENREKEEAKKNLGILVMLANNDVSKRAKFLNLKR